MTAKKSFFRPLQIIRRDFQVFNGIIVDVKNHQSKRRKTDLVVQDAENWICAIKVLENNFQNSIKYDTIEHKYLYIKIYIIFSFIRRRIWSA